MKYLHPSNENIKFMEINKKKYRQNKEINLEGNS